MPEQPDTVISLTLPAWQATLLSALIDPDQGITDLKGVIAAVLDHVQQGVQRPGAWERSWLLQALGDYWLANLERDPQVRHHDRPLLRGPVLAGAEHVRAEALPEGTRTEWGIRYPGEDPERPTIAPNERTARIAARAAPGAAPVSRQITQWRDVPETKETQDG